MFNTLLFISGVFIWAFNRQTQIRPSKSQKPQHCPNDDVDDDSVGIDIGMDTDMDIDIDDDGDNDAAMTEALNRSSLKNRRSSERERDTTTNLYFNDWCRYDERKQLILSSTDLGTNSEQEELEDSSDDDDDHDHDDSDDIVRNNDKGHNDPNIPLMTPAQGMHKSKTLPQQEKEMRKHLFRSISRLKIFSHLSDDAFLQCISFMEYVNLPESGSELFTEEKPFDGSFYVVIEGSMKIQCVLSCALREQGSGHDSQNNSKVNNHPIELSAGPGEVLISFLSALSGLVDTFQMTNGGGSMSGTGSEAAADGMEEWEEGLELLHGAIINDDQNPGQIVDVRAQSSQPNTRLIRVPPSAFVFMLQKHPHDVHQIAQTILARSQRVTIQTLMNNLGLGFDLLYNHGNKKPIKCDSRTILPPMSEEDLELDSIALDVLLECEELRNNVGGNSSKAESQCVRTLEIKDEELNRRLSRWVANSLGSTSSKCAEIIRKDASLIIVPPGKVLVETETKADYVYFVIDGSLEVGSMQNNQKGNKQKKSRRDENEGRTDGEDSFQLLYSVMQGDTVGQMSCFTNELSFVTVRSCANESQKSTVVLQLPKRTFCSLADEFSGVLIQCVNKILTVDFSPLVHLFDWGLQWKHVQAGMLLARKGEMCDQLQVVLSGRLKSGFNERLGDENEFGRGACIGQTHVITGSEWPEDIYAIRNSEIAVIPANVLEYLMNLFPQTAVHVAKSIAKKAQHKRRKATRAFSILEDSNELSVATIAVVPLCFDSVADAQELCDTITSRLEKIAPCKLMTRSIARQCVGRKVFQTRNAVHEQKMSRLFCDLEESSCLTVYQADAKFTWWTKLCIQQADHVLLVVNANFAPRCKQLEKYLSWAYEKRMVRHIKVLILQEVEQKTLGAVDKKSPCTKKVRVPVSDELNEWIEKQRWIEGQHLARLPFDVHDMDIARMCRRITGRSLGLALGGGGARGLAHIGVIRALMERNVTIDVCGGTSQGAFIGALYSKSPDSYEDLLENSRIMANNMASINKKLFDLTLPIVSYFNGAGFDQQIIESIGETTKFSDLLLDYFCTSTDLCRSSQVIHTKGLCWKYIRASMSLCGYLPPISEDGKLLVDGGYTNLVPGDILIEQMNAKAAICVDVAKEHTYDYYEYGTNLSGFWLLLNSLNPFAKTVRVPSMGELSQRLIWVSSTNHRKSLMDKVDLFLSPPVSNYGTLDYDKFDEIVDKGYQYAKPRVDAFIRENPWVVSA